MWNIINYYLKSIATVFGYNILYLFSYCQIKYNHLHNKLIPDKKHDDILKIEIFNATTNKTKYKNLSELSDEKYDCIIITKDTGIHPYDKMVVCNLVQPIKWNNNIKYKFLSLIAIIPGEEEFDIKLHSKTDNYYIVGNVIDKNFIKYYLEKYYKYNIKKDCSFTMQLIDHNVKLINLSMDKAILLLENNYEIK